MAITGVEKIARLFTALFFFFAAFACQTGFASECGIGLLPGNPITIDGADTGGLGYLEWGDASVLNSADPSSCLDSLMDKIFDAYSQRNITIKSKRYQRGYNWYLGFFFEVPDSTSSGSCAGGNLCIGEKIIMHFNRVINGDDKLNVSQDKRFALTHKWAGAGNDVTDGVIRAYLPISDASCAAETGVDVKWGPPGADGITYAIRKGLAGGGYSVEIEVPMVFAAGASGLPSNDIGVAIAIINDHGINTFGPPPDLSDCSPTGTCEAAGASFPSSLPETNAANAVDAMCDRGWTVPKQWGVGYLRAPAGQVTISRLPEFWNSNAIDVFECNSSTSSYTYYGSQPCKIRIRANLKNSGAAARRKVVYLWAKHGTGDPAEYKFVDLKEAAVNAGAPGAPSSTPIESSLWSGMPKNEANHPCLRVYIFPDSLSAADESILRGSAAGGAITRDSLLGVAARNGIEDQHWAQKNISRHDTITQCPNAECRVASLDPAEFDSLLKTAFAQNNSTGKILAVPAGQVGATFPGIDPYAKNHVIVQARTIAYRIPAAGRKPLFSFVEDFGGVVQLFPISMVQEKRELPFEFQVSNGSAATMRIKIQTEMYVPPGISGVTVNIDKKELTLQPNSVSTVQGTVLNTNIAPPKKFPLWLIILIIVIVLLLLILKYVKRNKP